MDKLDVYYRAFKEYRKETTSYNELGKERKSYSLSNIEQDELNSTKYICHIHSDWIEHIENGLEFVEKAIEESRQFIRTQSEITPIEKVKKVSKDTVVDLAKHSNYITHLPDNPEDDVIPDKLNIIEKLSDFAVYENRFLYMMLCFLNDFIYIRMTQIDKIRAAYIGNSAFTKSVKNDHREFTFQCRLYEKNDDNRYPVHDDESEKMILRIKNCQEIVNSLLKTPLMCEVSKSPMVKPPITKTNVLKMNNNFKHCLELYEYITSYEGKGYEVEEVFKNYAPLEESVSDEFSDVIGLFSFLSFKYGNDLSDLLETSFMDEERKRAEEEREKLKETVERMKKRAAESSMSLEAYMVVLEKYNQTLIHDSEELVRAKNEITELNKEIDLLNLDKEELKRKIADLHEEIEKKIEEIAALNQKYIDDMTRLKEEHEEEINNLNKKHKEETDNLISGYEEKISLINKEHEDIVSDIREEHEKEISSINSSFILEMQKKEEEFLSAKQKFGSEYEIKMRENNEKCTSIITDYQQKMAENESKMTDIIGKRDALIDSYENKINTLKKNYDVIVGKDENQINELSTKLRELENERILIKGENDALKAKCGLLHPNEENAKRERFIELEAEFKAFNDYFQKQWNYTKKQIKKEILK